MSRETLRPDEYLRHICTSIERIERYSAGMDKTAFLANELIQDAVIRNFNIIGDASRKIGSVYPAFAAAYPEFDFHSVCEMRHVLTPPHQADEPEIVWHTVVESLPIFKHQIQALMASPATQL